MLSTPGRSPRHLSLLPSPAALQGGGQDGGMGPPAARTKRQKRPDSVEVLDEDTYVEAIEHIVQRDYFPDIPRLQDRLEWLEALRSGDPELVRQAQMRIAKRRAVRRGESPAAEGTPSMPSMTPRSIAGTPGGIGTLPTPLSAAATPGPLDEGHVAGDEVAQAAQRARQELSLDDFLRSHTSQDNASFCELKEKENEKRRQKAARLHLLEGVPGSGQGELTTSDALKLAGPETKLLMDRSDEAGSSGGRKTDGYGSSGQLTSTLQLWPFKAKNELMYDSSQRDNVALTQEEISDRAMGPPKQVKNKNTRFRQSHAELQEMQSKDSLEETVAILYNPIPGETPQRYVDPNGERGSRKHYDLEDLQRTPRSSTGDGAAVASTDIDGNKKLYDYVSTPSFTPGKGPEASPLMTWGDIEGTPLRLEAEDTPLGIGGSADGPHFNIPAAPARDKAALGMSRVAARSLKERQQKLLGGATPGKSPLTWASPRASLLGSMSPSLRAGMGLSPAAQLLASRAVRRKRGSAVDATLRASYASPLRSPATSAKAKKGI